MGPSKKLRNFQIKVFNAKITYTLKKLKTQKKPNAAQFFLAYLLVLLPGDWPCFCFGAIDLIVGLFACLMIGLAISGIVSMALEIAVGLCNGLVMRLGYETWIRDPDCVSMVT